MNKFIYQNQNVLQIIKSNDFTEFTRTKLYVKTNGPDTFYQILAAEVDQHFWTRHNI